MSTSGFLIFCFTRTCLFLSYRWRVRPQANGRATRKPNKWCWQVATRYVMLQI